MSVFRFLVGNVESMLNIYVDWLFSVWYMINLFPTYLSILRFICQVAKHTYFMVGIWGHFRGFRA